MNHFIATYKDLEDHQVIKFYCKILAFRYEVKNYFLKKTGETYWYITQILLKEVSRLNKVQYVFDFHFHFFFSSNPLHNLIIFNDLINKFRFSVTRYKTKHFSNCILAHQLPATLYTYNDQ